MTKNRNDADVDFIKALAALLNENDLTEIDVMREYGENDSLSVRVSKQIATLAPPAHTYAPQPAAGASHAQAPAASDGPGAPASADDPAQHPGAVTSPMVGTAYLSPEPNAEPFVTVGSQVNEGQTLLIIEAMKTMNHIPSPRSGTVKRILIADASPVEFGAPLMIVE